LASPANSRRRGNVRILPLENSKGARVKAGKICSQMNFSGRSPSRSQETITACACAKGTLMEKLPSDTVWPVRAVGGSFCTKPTGSSSFSNAADSNCTRAKASSLSSSALICRARQVARPGVLGLQSHAQDASGLLPLAPHVPATPPAPHEALSHSPRWTRGNQQARGRVAPAPAVGGVNFHLGSHRRQVLSFESPQDNPPGDRAWRKI